MTWRVELRPEKSSSTFIVDVPDPEYDPKKVWNVSDPERHMAVSAATLQLDMFPCKIISSKKIDGAPRPRDAYTYSPVVQWPVEKPVKTIWERLLEEECLDG